MSAKYAHPSPDNFPSYRAPSTQDGPRFKDAQHREKAATAFYQGAQTYDAVRPNYPKSVVDLLADQDTVIDIGAGTGKFTEQLTNATVWACDPSQDMARILRHKTSIPVWRACAENTGLPDNSVDAIVCAQSWHWVEASQASAECARIIRDQGKLVLAWNTLDVTAHPWVLRLARIMHSGDIHRPGFYPDVSHPWQLDQEIRTTWTHKLRPEQLHLLMHTRSYWLNAKEHIRERMTHNLNWYLYEHLGFEPGHKIELPYRSDAFVYRLAEG